jgi:DNA-binding NarL/FixJ family response regulator
MNSGTYRIVLADDHLMFRRGIRKILEAMNDIEIVGEAEDGISLVNLLKTVSPHMVIIDQPMGNLWGGEATRLIKMIKRDIKVMILSAVKARGQLHQAISAGADGYLLKDDGDIELLLAIERIRKGKAYVSPILSAEPVDEASQKHPGDHERFTDPLTPREGEIIKLIAEAKTSKEIARMLCISVRTVECHRLNIMRKLNLRNTSGLVRYAMLKEFASTAR